MTRLAAFTYLALGIAWLLVQLYDTNFDNFSRHPTYLIINFLVALIAPLFIFLTRSLTVKWVAAMVLFLAVVAWILQPDGGLQ